MNDTNAKREKRVPASLGHLNKAVTELREALERLEADLTPVITTTPPTTCDQENPERGDSVCALSRDIDGYRLQVEQLVIVVRDLCARLEV